jgi:threonine dehydratase
MQVSCKAVGVPEQARARDEGLVFVAPYDDPFTIAGQGTIGTELLRQLSSADSAALHAVFVAIGGGGLIAGVASYLKALRPDVKIIGVEPAGALPDLALYHAVRSVRPV